MLRRPCLRIPPCRAGAPHDNAEKRHHHIPFILSFACPRRSETPHPVWLAPHDGAVLATDRVRVHAQLGGLWDGEYRAYSRSNLHLGTFWITQQRSDPLFVGAPVQSRARPIL